MIVSPNAWAQVVDQRVDHQVEDCGASMRGWEVDSSVLVCWIWDGLERGGVCSWVR